MILNDNTKIISANDIFIPGDPLFDLNTWISNTNSSIGKLTSMLAWAYNHGGLGGSTGISGPGGITANNFGINVKIDGEAISSTGGIVPLNKDVKNHTLQVKITRGGSDSFLVSLGYNGMNTSKIATVADNNFSVTFPIDITSNTKISLVVMNTVTEEYYSYKDSDNNIQQTVFYNIITNPYSFDIAYYEGTDALNSVAVNTENAKIISDTLFMSDYMSKGLLLGMYFNIAINTINFANSSITYTDWKSSKVTKTFADMNIVTNGDGYVYFPLIGSDDMNTFLSNNENAGTYITNFKINLILNDTTEPIIINRTLTNVLIPRSIYLKCTPSTGTILKLNKTNYDSMFTDSFTEEQQIPENGFMLGIVPYNGEQNNESFNYEYHLYKADENYYTQCNNPESVSKTSLYVKQIVPLDNNTIGYMYKALSENDDIDSNTIYYILDNVEGKYYKETSDTVKQESKTYYTKDSDNNFVLAADKSFDGTSKYYETVPNTIIINENEPYNGSIVTSLSNISEIETNNQSGSLKERTADYINIVSKGTGARFISIKLWDANNLDTNYYALYTFRTKASSSDFNWYPFGDYIINKSASAFYRKGIEAQNIFISNALRDQSLANIEMASNDVYRTIELKTNIGNNISNYDNLLGIGIQYSKINNYNIPICSFNVKGSLENNSTVKSGSIFIYQNKVVIASDDVDISTDNFIVNYTDESTLFVPLTEDYDGTDLSKYHLINIYKNIESYDNYSNTFYHSLNCYIDGTLDGVMKKFFSANYEYNSVTFYPGSYYINLIESSYLDHTDNISTDKGTKRILSTSEMSDTDFIKRTFMTENDIKGYYYCYRELLCGDEKSLYSKRLWDLFNQLRYTNENYVVVNNADQFLKQLTDKTGDNVKAYNDVMNGLVMHLKFNNTNNISGSGIGYDNSVNGEDVFKKWLDRGYQENDNSAAAIGKIPVSVSISNNGSGMNTIYAPDGSNTPAIFELQLQGSSTKSYLAKNFELYYPNDSQSTIKYIYSPNWKLPSNLTTPNEHDEAFDTFLPEESFTLKGDIVDSSHTINTAIGKFVNDVTTKFQGARAAQPSSNVISKNYIKNCLLGIPMLLFVSSTYNDVNGNPKTDTYLLGIYNFNLGRKSYNNLGINDLTAIEKIINHATSDTKNSPDGTFKIYSVNTEENSILHTVEGAEIQGNNPEFDFSQWEPSILWGLKNSDGEDDGTGMWGDYVMGGTNSLDTFKSHLQQMVKDVAIGAGDIFTMIGKKMIGDDNPDEYAKSLETLLPDDIHKAYGYGEGYNKQPIAEKDVSGTFDIYRGWVPNYKYQMSKKMIDNTKLQYSWNKLSDTDLGAQTDLDRLTRIANLVLDWIPEGSNIANVPRIDLVSLSEYYLIVMAFAMVDSVKKNLNVRAWATSLDAKTIAEIWYIVFYDMDTALGINNGGGKISFFAFSDYWNSIINKDAKTGKNILGQTTIWRDYAPSDINKSAEFFDAPSTYLFAIAKYVYPIFKAYLNNGDPMYDAYFGTSKYTASEPSNLWATFRQNPDGKEVTDGNYVINRNNLKAGALRSARFFMDVYFNGYLNTIPDETFNFDYKYKYLTKVGNGKELAYDEDDNSGSRTGLGADNIDKFWGRKNNYIEYWLSGRLHLMDAYMNINGINDIIYNTGSNIIYAAAPGKNNSNWQNNADVLLSRDIFSSGTGGNQYSQGTRTIEITANEYAPMIISNAGKNFTRYLFPENSEPVQLTITVDGLTTLGYLGSQQWQNISSINGFINYNGSLSISSDYLQSIIGNDGTIKNTPSLNCPALKTLSLTGKNYKLNNFAITGDNINYKNLNSIDLSNTQSNLTITNSNVRNITMNNMQPGSGLTMRGLQRIESVNISGNFSNIHLEAWSNNITLPSGGTLNTDKIEIENPNISVNGVSVPRFTDATVNITGGDESKILVSNFAYINISGTKKLYDLNIVGEKYVKGISIVLPQDYDASTKVSENSTETIQHDFILKVNGKTSMSVDIDNPQNVVFDLSKFTNLEYVQFTNCKTLTKIIFPNKTNGQPIILKDSCFENTAALNTIQYANSAAFENPIEDNFVTGKPSTQFEIDGAKVFSQTSFNKFIGTFFFENENNIETILNISKKCTTLEKTFNTGNTTDLNIECVYAFLNNIYSSDIELKENKAANITSINSMFMGNSNIILDVNTEFNNGYQNNTSTINLMQFVNCTNWENCFNSTGVTFLNKYIFKYVPEGKVTPIGLGINIISNNAFKYKSLFNSSITTTYDGFEYIIQNMEEYETNDIIYLIDKDNQNSIKYIGRSQDDPIVVNNLFCNNNIKPEKLNKISGLNFTASYDVVENGEVKSNPLYYDLSGLFDQGVTNKDDYKWIAIHNNNQLHIENSLNNMCIGSNTDTNKSYTAVNTLFANCNVNYIVGVLNNITFVSDTDNYIDIYDLFDWGIDEQGSLKNDYTSLKNLTLMFVNPDQRSTYNVDKNGLNNTNKRTTYTHMQYIVKRLLTLPLLKGVSGLFSNAKIIMDDTYINKDKGWWNWCDDNKYCDLAEWKSSIEYIPQFAEDLRLIDTSINSVDYEGEFIKVNHDFYKFFTSAKETKNAFASWLMNNTMPADILRLRSVVQTNETVYLDENHTQQAILKHYSTVNYSRSKIENGEGMFARWNMKPVYPDNIKMITDPRNSSNNSNINKTIPNLLPFSLELLTYDNNDKFDNIWKGKYAFHIEEDYNKDSDLDGNVRNIFELAKLINSDGTNNNQEYYYTADSNEKKFVINTDEDSCVYDAVIAEKDDYSTYHYIISTTYAIWNNACVDPSGCYIAPDLLYGLKKSAGKLISTPDIDYVGFTGTIPVHFFKQFFVSGMFTGFNITPISFKYLYGNSYTDEELHTQEKLDKERNDSKLQNVEYRYYSFIPNGLINSSTIASLTNSDISFNITLPYTNIDKNNSNDKYIEYFFIGTNTSIPTSLVKMSSPWPNIKTDDNSILSNGFILTNDIYSYYNTVRNNTSASSMGFVVKDNLIRLGLIGNVYKTAETHLTYCIVGLNSNNEVEVNEINPTDSQKQSADTLNETYNSKDDVISYYTNNKDKLANNNQIIVKVNVTNNNNIKTVIASGIPITSIPNVLAGYDKMWLDGLISDSSLFPFLSGQLLLNVYEFNGFNNRLIGDTSFVVNATSTGNRSAINVSYNCVLNLTPENNRFMSLGGQMNINKKSIINYDAHISGNRNWTQPNTFDDAIKQINII